MEAIKVQSVVFPETSFEDWHEWLGSIDEKIKEEYR